MDHFSVVQGITRAGLSGDGQAFDKQVRRLQARLQKAGSSKEAVTLDRLLDSASGTRDIQPNRMTISIQR